MDKLIVIFCLCLAGCTSVEIPNYIKADHTYTRKIYDSYDRVVAATRRVLEHAHWKVVKETSPEVYEHGPESSHNTQNAVLLFTEIKQLPRFLYSSYAHLNVYIQSTPDGSLVEVRYAKHTPILGKEMQSTKNDQLVEGLLDKIEQDLSENK